MPTAGQAPHDDPNVDTQAYRLGFRPPYRAYYGWFSIRSMRGGSVATIVTNGKLVHSNIRDSYPRFQMHTGVEMVTRSIRMTRVSFALCAVVGFYGAYALADERAVVEPTNKMSPPPAGSVHPASRTTPKDDAKISAAVLPPKDDPGIATYQMTWRRLFRDVLRNAEANMLFVPCMVAVDAVAALDRTERMLISKQIASALESSGAGEQLDLELVARALGERRRRFDFNEIRSLAAASHASTIVTCDTGYRELTSNHADEARVRAVTIELRRFDNISRQGSVDQFVPAKAVDIEFDDELNLPYRAIVPELASLLADLGFESKPVNRSATKDQKTEIANAASFDRIPASPRELLDSGPAANHVHGLTALAFVAAMFPEIPEIGAERVATKLLIEAERLPLRDPLRPTFVARALYVLGRRPAALAMLESASTPVELAMVAVLNGDLVGLEEYVPQISNPLLRLVGLADLMDVRYHYNALPSKRRKEIVDSTVAETGSFAPIIESRLTTSDVWRTLGVGELKRTLDETFPVSGIAFDDLIAGKLVLNQDAFGEFFFENSVVTHVEKLLKRDPSVWCCQRRRGVDEWDILNLIVSINESQVFKKIDLERVARGRPEAALTLIGKVEPLFDGHPEFHRIRLAALLEQAKSLAGSERGRMVKRAARDLRAAVYRSGGQSWASGRALTYDRSAALVPNAFSSFAIYDVLIHDFPMRQHWPDWSHGGYPPAVNHNMQDRLEQTTFYFYSAEKFLRKLNAAEAADFLEKLGTRFRGSDAKLRLQLKYASEMGEEVVRDLLEDAIARKSSDFTVYEMYATRKIESGEFDKARGIALQYPGLANDDYSSVVRSNNAYDAGSLFFWRGLASYAREFYEKAAEIGSGSGGDITSQQRLALLNGDYASAATIALRRANRYSSAYAYRDYLFLLFALGYSDEAWAGFNALLGSITKPQIWEAVDAGKRIDGDTDSEVVQWLLEFEPGGHLVNYTRATLAVAFRFFVADRDFDENVVEAIRKLTVGQRTYLDPFEGYSYKIIDVEDGQLNPGITGPSAYAGHRNALVERVREIRRNDDQAAIIRMTKETLPSDFVQFAEAYAAWSAGRYGEAAKKYEALAETYELYRDDSKWMLPYFSAGLAAAGETEDLKKYLEEFPHAKRRFDWHLAQAYVAAYETDADTALEHLDRSLNMRPHTEERFVFTPYQWAQACEVAYTLTGDDRLRERLVDWARKVQIILPYKAWAYAIEAQYTKDADAREQALAMALYLDPLSTRLRQFDEAEKQAARAAQADRNVFRKIPVRGEKTRA